MKKQLQLLQDDLQKAANSTRAALLQRFFKTKEGEYGHGDRFLGISVPVQRVLAKKYKELPLDNVQILLQSPLHEYRLTALIIMTLQYKQFPEKRRDLYNLYLHNTQWINNWDLVDTSASQIVGEFLQDKSRDILYTLVKSTLVWERRIAIIATFAFIRRLQFKDTLQIAALLLHDPHDLIHKAVGWALREVGKKDQQVLKAFLHKHYKTMPRTMLRYAIEKFPDRERQFYLIKPHAINKA